MPDGKAKNTSDSRIASLKLHDREYNEMYRKWKINHKNDYGFYFEGGGGELTYRDGMGFITEYPEAAERSAITRTHTVIANTLIIYTAMNILVSIFFSVLPIVCSVDFSYDPGGYFTGNEKTSIILIYIIKLAEIIPSAVYLVSRVKMPVKVMLPVKILNKPLFYEAIPMAVLIWGIITLLSDMRFFGSIKLLEYVPINTMWLPENRAAAVFYAVMTVILIPAGSELIYRGVFMQIFRQFGDGYALFITSVLSAITAGSAYSFLVVLICSLVTGYFTVRTGSVLTAVIMRVIMRVGEFTDDYLRFTGIPDGIRQTFLCFAVVVSLIVGIVSLVLFMKKHSKRIPLPLYRMYLTNKERIMCFVTNPSMLIWLALIFLRSAVSACAL
ncbi:MAG: CPBP family intramembrane metalloprotease [Ruminococcus sp.]|nr:CPBP family intramembrane metalloprotease [Ruminococcus sp.]